MHRDITVSSSERRSKAYNAFLIQFSHVISLPSHFYTTIFNLLSIDFLSHAKKIQCAIYRDQNIKASLPIKRVSFVCGYITTR